MAGLRSVARAIATWARLSSERSKCSKSRSAICLGIFLMAAVYWPCEMCGPFGYGLGWLIGVSADRKTIG